MNGLRASTREISPTVSGNSLKTVQRALLGLFLAAAGVLIAQRFISFPLPSGDGIWDAGVLVLALVTTLVSLSAQLPFQNVLLAAVIIGVIGGAIHSLGFITGIPFGPLVYTEDSGPQLFNTLSWSAPLIWIVVILNSRGVARLILRPWRRLRVYGYWLIGITTVLALLFDFGLEPFATRINHFWFWRPTKLAIDWYGTPVSNFLGWLVSTLLILAFATPSLMKKKPAKSSPDYGPLAVWIALSLLFIAGSVTQHLWLAAAVSAIGCLAVIPFAIHGARW